MTSYCAACTCPSLCRRRARVVSDLELKNPEFIRDVREFGRALGKSPGEWLDYVLENYARFDGCIVNQDGRSVLLSTHIFLPTDEEVDDGNAGLIENRMRNWFEETFVDPTPAHVTPQVRYPGSERFRIVATVLRAAYPVEAMMWGVRAANDNSAPIPPQL